MLAERLLTLDESISTIMASIAPVETERAGVINTPGKTLAEDIICETSGEVLLPKGTVIGASEMGLLAEIGRPGVKVSRRPRVSIITSGDEVVDLLEEALPGKHRNINRYSLAGRVLSTGCEIGRLIHADDASESLRRAIYSARSSDVIVVTDGDRDRVRNVVLEMDGLVFNGLSIEPGGCASFSIREWKAIFSLPGNACEAAIVFELIVRPALSAMLGRAETPHRTVRAVSDDRFTHTRGIQSFFPASYDRVTVRKLGSDSMADLVRANAIAVVPEDLQTVEPGQEIDVLLTHSSSHSV